MCKAEVRPSGHPYARAAIEMAARRALPWWHPFARVEAVPDPNYPAVTIWVWLAPLPLLVARYRRWIAQRVFAAVQDRIPSPASLDLRLVTWGRGEEKRG